MMYFDIDATLRDEWRALSESWNDRDPTSPVSRVIRDVKARWTPGADPRAMMRAHAEWIALHRATVLGVHKTMRGADASADLADELAHLTSAEDIADAIASMPWPSLPVADLE